MWGKIKQIAKVLKSKVGVLYFAYKDKATPFYAKLLAGFTVGYAFSPIDLIPDFIPILGYLDDIILLPVLIWVCIKLIPNEVIKRCTIRANNEFLKGKYKNYIAAGIIVALWGGAIILVISTCVN